MASSMQLDKEWDDIVKSELRRWKVPGIAMAVVHGEKSSTKAYGLAELPDKKLEPDSLFPTMSTTKAFLAAATALVIDDTKESKIPLNWDTPISSVIPNDFDLPDISFEDALSHRSGQPEHSVKFRLAPRNEDIQTADYNNYMYITVSHALAQKTGESLDTFLRRRIWDPLDMNDTYFDLEKVQNIPEKKDRLVAGYEWVQELNRFKLEEHLNYPPLKGVGSTVSNVLDYEKWIKALLKKSTPLSNEGHEAIFHPRTILSKPVNVSSALNCAHLYALGWFVDNYQGYPFYWHTGGWPGVSILLGLIPDKDFGFVMMSNSYISGRELQIVLYHRLINRYLHLPLPSSILEAEGKDVSESIGYKKPETISEAVQRLFPKSDGTSTGPILPLAHYAGTYTNPGYGSISIEFDNGNEALYANLLDRVIPTRMDLEHVEGNCFLAKLYEPGWDSAGVEYYKAEFHLAPNDKVDRVGFNFEPALGEGKMIWFAVI